jgi:hypothetical protein
LSAAGPSGSSPSAIVEVLTRFLGTDALDIDVQGTPSFTVTRHFATADDLRAEVNDARIWGGVHYRFSVQAGSALGREVADDALRRFHTCG